MQHLVLHFIIWIHFKYIFLWNALPFPGKNIFLKSDLFWMRIFMEKLDISLLKTSANIHNSLITENSSN